MNLISAINSRLNERQVIDDQIGYLLELAHSPARFDSQEALRAHLAEGAMLNITKIAGDCLSIPNGHYCIWLTDSGKTVLAPAPERAQEVLTKSEDKYELHTAKLLGMWNKLERIISEAPETPNISEGPRQNWRQGNERQDVAGHFTQAPEEIPDSPYTFGTTIDRPALWQAMQRAGLGVSELADTIGVDKSTVSRLLRKVQHGPGDPHGRNPSVAVAQKIASVLGVDVNEVLPPPEDLHITQRAGTSGSGAGGGKNAKQMTQGNTTGDTAPQESKLQNLANLMVECKVNPIKAITEALIGIPNAEPTLNEFLGSMLSQRCTALDTIVAFTKIATRTGNQNRWISGIQRNLTKKKP